MQEKLEIYEAYNKVQEWTIFMLYSGNQDHENNVFKTGH